MKVSYFQLNHIKKIMARSKKEQDIGQLLSSKETSKLGENLLRGYINSYVLKNEKYITLEQPKGYMSAAALFELHGPCFNLGYIIDDIESVYSHGTFFIVKKHTCFLKLKSLFKWLFNQDNDFYYVWSNIYRTKNHVACEKIESLNDLVYQLYHNNEGIRSVLDTSNGRLINTGRLNYSSIYAINAGLKYGYYYTLKEIDESLYY